MSTTKDWIAEALAGAHVMLGEELRRLEEAARPGPGEGPAALAARLSATRAHLAEHFRLDEHDGYMDAVREREPSLEKRVQELAEEHRGLMQSLDARLRRAGAAGGVGDLFRGAVRAWVKRVRRHEARETDLIQEAFTVDVGPED